MSERRRGLGKGLGALIPTAPTDPAASGAAPSGASVIDLGAVRDRPVISHSPRGVDAVLDAADTVADGNRGEGSFVAHYAELPLDAIIPNRKQPRQVFDDEALAELAYSLQQIGLLQPVVVRPLGAGRFELVAGERRWRAAQAAGFTLIPAIVRDTADDALLRDALLENLHRAQLNPLEEAAAYDQLLSDFGCTQDELATRIGRSRPQVTNTLRLLRLPPEVARRVAAGVLSAGHARALLALPSDDDREALAKRIVAEGLSVRAVEELVALGWTAEPVPDPDTTKTRRRADANPAQSAVLRDVAAGLSDRLETRVAVTMGRHKGRIAIDFASLADLSRVLDVLDAHASATYARALQPPSP